MDLYSLQNARGLLSLQIAWQEYSYHLIPLFKTTGIPPGANGR